MLLTFKSALCLTAILFGSSLSLIAEETPDSNSVRKFPVYERPLMATLTWGPRIPLGNPGNNDKIYFGPIPNLYYSLNYRFAGCIFKHWGLYGEAGFSTYSPETDWDAIYGEHFEDAELQCGLGFVINPTIEAGILYQTTYRRWSLQASAGYGYTSINSPSKVSYIVNENIVEPHIEIERNISTDYVACDFTIGYRTSRILNIILNIGYTQPLRSASLKITRHENSSSETMKYHSKAWGHELSVSVGLQLMCEGRRKKNKH